MKPFVRSLGICAAVVSIAAAAVVVSARRKTPDPALQTFQRGSGWITEFQRLYPAPMGLAAEPPSLGRTGDLGNKEAFELMLTGFPKEELPSLEKWLRGRMKASAISKVLLHGIFPMEEFRGQRLFTAETIILHGDGRREEIKNMSPSPLSLNGRPISLDSDR